jgi:hypothetical protein
MLRFVGGDELAPAIRGRPDLLRPHQPLEHRANRRCVGLVRLQLVIERHRVVQLVVGERPHSVEDAAGQPEIVLDQPLGQIHIRTSSSVCRDNEPAGRVEMHAVRRLQPEAGAPKTPVHAWRRAERPLECARERLERSVARRERRFRRRDVRLAELPARALEQETPPERGRRLLQCRLEESIEVEPAHISLLRRDRCTSGLVDTLDDEVDERP